MWSMTMGACDCPIHHHRGERLLRHIPHPAMQFMKGMKIRWISLMLGRPPRRRQRALILRTPPPESKSDVTMKNSEGTQSESASNWSGKRQSASRGKSKSARQKQLGGMKRRCGDKLQRKRSERSDGGGGE